MEEQNTTINPQKIWFFKPLDELMKTACKNNKEYFCSLFERKKMLIELLKQGKVDAQKYLNIISKTFKTEPNQKHYIQEDLLQYKDKYNKNVDEWFRAKIDETGAFYQDQEKIYLQFKTNSIPQQKMIPQKQQKLTKPQHIASQSKNIIKQQGQQNSKSSIQQIQVNLNYTQILNLKALDSFMSKYHQTSYKSVFIQLFDKKQKLFQAINNKVVTPQLYLKSAQKIFTETQNEQLKKMLKIDIQTLGDLHDGNIQKWFMENLNQSKEQLQKQRDIYQKHKKGIIVKKIQIDDDLDLSNLTDQSTAEIDPRQCFSFSVIDKYMDKNTENYQTYIILYDKKQKMLESVRKNQLNAVKYQQLLKKAIKSVQNQKLKILYESDLENITDLNQGNIKQWWQQILDQTKSNLMMQEEQYKTAKQQLKTAPKKSIKVQEKVPSKKATQKIIEQEPAAGLSYQVEKMFNLKILDNSLMMEGENDQLFIKLFSQKQKIINLMQEGKIDAKKYKAMQQKLMKDFADNEQLRSEIEFEVMAVEDMHNGDINAWFQQVVQNAGLQYEQQLARYQQLTKSIKSSKSSKKQIQKVEVKQNIPSTQSSQNNSLDISKIQSLKIIDNGLLMYGEDDSTFIKLFAQKQKILDDVKNSKLDAKKYKSLQQKMLIAFADNQQIKGQIQFDISAINDLHDGDINAWFQQNIQNAQLQYEDQLSRYQELISSQKQQKKQSTSQNVSTSKNSLVPPPANQVLCFTAINQGFLTFVEDSQFTKILHQKRQKFIEWTETSKLTAEKYITMCQKIFNSTTNNWLKQRMKAQKNQLSKEFTDNQQKWFRAICKKLKQKPKTQLDSKVSLAQDSINQGSSKSKIRYFLHQMSVYESWAKYYKNNGLNATKNQLLKIYITVPRKDIEETISKIQQDASFDVISYCKKFLPAITEATFHTGGVEAYKQKIGEYISSFNQQIESFKQYGKKLVKKSVNTKNIETVKKKIDESTQNIKYLTNLSNNPSKLIPIPLIQENIVEYPNMDQLNHLQKNQIQLKILSISNADVQPILKIYFLGEKTRQQTVRNGNSNISVKVKANQTDMANIMKGEKACFSLSIYKKGWFSSSQLGKQQIEVQFIRSNIYEGKVQVGGASITYESRVRMCKRPTMTSIKQFKLTKYPPYEHSKQVQKQFIAKYTASKNSKK